MENKRRHFDSGDLEEDTTFFELPVLKNGGRLLRNARTYGLTSQNELLEVRRVECVKNMKASWFVDDNVVSDDSVYVLTKMDPNYLFCFRYWKLVRETDSWSLLKPLVKLDSDG